MVTQAEEEQTEDWKRRSEANRLLRQRYTADPDSLSPEEQAKAMVLLQRDARKLRKQQTQGIGGALGNGRGARSRGPGSVQPVSVGPAVGHLLRSQKRASTAAAAAAAAEVKSAAAPAPSSASATDSAPPGNLNKEELEAWQQRKEANRQLRQRYAADPESLSPEEQTKALVLLQRDQRKIRQQQKRKKEAAAATEQTRKNRQKATQNDPRKVPKESAQAARQGEWAPQADASTVEQNRQLRIQYKANPESLSQEQRERAQVLLKRDEKKKAKKERLKRGIAKHREKAGLLPIGPKASTSQLALAKKWGIAEKLVAAGRDRQKKGLLRGDWLCPNCTNKNFARRKECAKCNTAAPEGHDRWIGELRDVEHWKKKEAEQLARGKGRWDCPQCRMVNAGDSTECCRCGEAKASISIKPPERIVSATMKTGPEESNAAAPGEGNSKAKREAKRLAKLKAKFEAKTARNGPTDVKPEQTNLQDAKDEKADREAREGPDWTCVNCGNVNWGRRDKCNRCPQLKNPPKEIVKKQKQKEKKAKEKQKRTQANAGQKDKITASTRISRARGTCELVSTIPPGPGDPETKRYICKGCKSELIGYKAWRKHLNAQKKALKRQQTDAATKTQRKKEQRKRKKLRETQETIAAA